MMISMRMAYFEVPGEPKGKGRPRATKRGDHIKIYSPKDTVIYENYVRMMYINGRHPKIEGPIKMKVAIYFPIPKSVSKKKQEAMSDGRILPTVKKDIDNCLKAILDGLNTVAYDDDKQIVELTARKAYSYQPRVCVALYQIQPDERGEQL